MEHTFGSFVRERRQACGLSLRGLAAKLDLSPVYMSNIENDRRAAPTQEYLERLAMILGLDKTDREWMLDLAAKSQHNRVSADLRQRRRTPRIRSGRISSTGSTAAWKRAERIVIPRHERTILQGTGAGADRP